jgi:hypothetical protein
MTDLSKYRVILSGNVLPEKTRSAVIDGLVSLFGSQPATMEKLLQGKPVPLKKAYELDPARKICEAIREVGAECRMEEISAPEVSLTEDDYQDRLQENKQDNKVAAHCPNCQRSISANWKQCQHCGFNLEVGFEEEESEFTSYTADRDHSEEFADTSPDQDSPDQELSALMRFVKVNQDYYRHQFAKFGSVNRPSFTISWHWPSFFAFFFWALYRKMWMWAGINLVGGLILMLMIKPGIIFLVWALFWPFTANYLYFRHARNQVSRVSPTRAETSGEGEQPNQNQAGHNQAGRNQAGGEQDYTGGGVSHMAVWLGAILMFILSAALNNTIAVRMMEQYSDQIGDILPGAGSQQRGDGSVIQDLATLDPPTAKTATTLSMLAVTLKLVTTGKMKDDNQQALSIFKQQLEQKQVKDAWGTPIVINEDAAGQFVLVSAGPDQQFNSNDDILQFISFDSP